MTNYLYIFRGGEMAGMTPRELQENMKKWGAWIGELSQKGYFKGGDPLEDGGARLVGKSKTVVDGPFAEAKDLVGGYLLVTAESQAHAVELAKGCPLFERDGSVEVRAIRKMDP
jgi:hypothetical protein